MSLATLYCNKCQKPSTFDIRRSPFNYVCAHCARANEVTIFPALFREAPKSAVGEHLLDDTESSCFYHPNKRATVPCDACGRYLCALCDIQTGEKHLCPSCVASPLEESAAQQPAVRATQYDNIALTLAILPVITVYFTIITAPIALYIAIRYWNKTQSAVPRGKWRSVVAILFSALQIIGWVTGFGVVFYQILSTA